MRDRKWQREILRSPILFQNGRYSKTWVSLKLGVRSFFRVSHDRINYCWIRSGTARLQTGTPIYNVDTTGRGLVRYATMPALETLIFFFFNSYFMSVFTAHDHIPEASFPNPGPFFQPSCLCSGSHCLKVSPPCFQLSVSSPQSSLHCVCFFLCYFWRHMNVESCPCPQPVLVCIFFVVRTGVWKKCGLWTAVTELAEQESAPGYF